MLICPAVHIPTRSLLRSSSTPEPSDPLCSVVTFSDSFRLPGQQSPCSLFQEICSFGEGTAASSFLHGEGEQRFAERPTRGERPLSFAAHPLTVPPGGTRETSTATVTKSQPGDVQRQTGRRTEQGRPTNRKGPNQAEAGSRTDPISDKSRNGTLTR